MKIKNQRQQIGRWGESVAANYLISKGYSILYRNMHTRYGEIDLIAHKDELLIFVEVKTRTSLAFGYPEEAITPLKQTHMLNAAEQFFSKNLSSIENWQFDVISIKGRPGIKPEITHFENVLS